MKKLSLPKKNFRMKELIETTEHKVLAIWAIDCLERFMPYLENNYPNENRPRTAINILKKWLNDEISMWEARKYCFSVLAFGREIEESDKIGCQIARACSHTLATCHVPTHCEIVTLYTLSSMQYQNQDKKNVFELMESEREWQINHLIELRNRKAKNI